MNERYVRLYSLPASLYAEGAPVIVSAGSLLGDNATGMLLAQLKLKNISPKAIRAVKVRIRCMDPNGTPLEGDAEQQFADIYVRPGEEFGQQTAIPLSNGNTRAYMPELAWVAFEDNSVWRSEGQPWEPLPAPKPLQEQLGDPELVRQVQIQVGGPVQLAPQEYRDLWRCACGSWNREPRCTQCGTFRERILPLNLQELSAARDQRLAREQEERAAAAAAEAEAARLKAEQDAQKKAKNRKTLKRVGLISLGVLLAAFLTYAAIWHVVPYIRYSGACKDLESGAYDEAYSTFAALGDFSDSGDKAVETLYRKGEALQKAGSFREAAETYEKVPDYLDSGEQAAFCRSQAAYLDAGALLDAGSYREASEAFAALGDFSDSRERKREADYLLAGELLGEGQYMEACELFTALEDYKDSREQSKEARYLYAAQCFDRGDYEKALEAFGQLKDYKDTAARLQETKYHYAQTLEQKKDWKGASALYKELGDYQDSRDRFRETYYQYGLQALNGRSYDEAVRVFESLGDYQESGSRLQEAKYGYVLQNKDRSNRTTYAYLQELTAANYKDTKEIYASLYAWHVTVVVNDSENDLTTNKSDISKYKTVYFHFTVSGGAPGESFTLRAKATWPNGATNSLEFEGNWTNGDYGSYYCWYSNPAYGSTGKLHVKFYNYGTGDVLGEASVNLTS